MKLQIAVSRASLKFLWGGLVQWLGRQISYQWVPDLSPGPVETQFGLTDLEQITFTPCLLLVKPRKRWTDDRLGQTVTGLVSMLCLMCLV